jgi:hypothetical protein
VLQIPLLFIVRLGPMFALPALTILVLTPFIGSSPLAEGPLLWLLIGVVLGGAGLGIKAGEYLAEHFANWVDDIVNPLDIPTFRDERLRDRRAPIVYLRSFQDDAAGAGQESRLEAAFSNEARRIGPFVAIAQPGAAPVRGAARVSFSGDAWREAVTGYMDQARIIVMVASWTQGLVWELQTLIENGHANKLVLLFPPRDFHHEARCAWVRACFKGQPHEVLLGRADLANALAISFHNGPRLSVTSGRDELGAAFAVAAYGVLRNR